MNIFVTGATGFIGRALVPRLQRDGHQVTAWVRSESRARNALGADVSLVPTSRGDAALAAAVGAADAVVNLAGEPLVGKRWTPERRRVLESSRVQTTTDVVRAIAAAATRPRVLVSGSAVGVYGDRGDERLTEESAPGDDFLARLCLEWERAALAAREHGVRVMALRTSVVLGREGGALAQMLPPFQVGAGGPIGNGRQYVPWIHLHDLVDVIVSALTDDRYSGAVNGVAPEEATSRQFAAALGRALHRPAMLPAPAFALQALFGEAATVLLASQRVEPRVLTSLGFRFAFPTLDAALRDIVNNDGPQIRSAPALGDLPAEDRVYFAGRPPSHELRATTIVDAPIDQVSAFFARPENLGLMTPPSMAFTTTAAPSAMERGAAIDYDLRVAGVPIAWRTLITAWEPGRRFVDIQERGPYRVWWHEHTFAADGARTVMTDRVLYAPPLGAIGSAANDLFVAPSLRRIFAYRGDVIRLRFGTAQL